MARPLTMLRCAVAAYTFSCGAGLLAGYVWECVREGGAMVGGGVRHPMGAAGSITLGVWLASVVFTGWRGMDREGRA